MHASTFALKQCCGFGRGTIGIILPESDPNPFPFQPGVKLNYTFSRNFKILSKILKIMPRKMGIQCELALLGRKVKKISAFSNKFKIGQRSKWKVGSGSASKRCRFEII